VRASPKGSVSALAFTTIATIRLAVVPLASTDLTGSFAGNLASSTPQTVFSGSVSLPVRGFSFWPPPWEAPIPFSTPYFYVSPQGKSLVVDIVHQGGAGEPWSCESWDPDWGPSPSVVNVPMACRLWIGTLNISTTFGRGPYPGGSWTLAYSTSSFVTLPQTGFALLGVLGPGASWAGQRLPLSLAPFGAPGCTLDVSMDVVLALRIPMPSFGIASIVIDVPNQPGVAGAIVYDQGVFLDPRANAFGVVTSASRRWSLDTPKGGPGALVTATGAGAATTPAGTYLPGKVTTLQLN
jgi:hypothetical protein